MVTCLNMSPLKNGISSDLTPVEIIIGSPNTYYNKLKITFGEYSQVCIGTTNSTKKITVVLIALRPDNEQVRHYFMSLATLKQLHAHIFTKLTNIWASFTKVDELSMKGKHPDVTKRYPIF